ncbi:unnamed protein product [Adineta steineri]|uniref:Uncharacterized protein n=1 Tax=Adineta steineri TaxID=433720 RepID=A0A819VDZ8_9BILA|nr:unnamed protein product [Adineta steineri]CAF4107254.1 unnamed protein product [Adineta steineri]
MLNHALRTLDADIITNMGFFLHDLHQQIHNLYEQQVNTYERKPFVIYRGQGFMISDFEKLQKTKGGLISFNNFLSTSKDKYVSMRFAQRASTEPNKMGILFIMSIDPCVKSVPFASVKKVSAIKSEDEIIFSMHTVFRMGAIQQMQNNNQLYQVELQLTSDDDQQLRLLTNRIRQEVRSHTGWQRLGDLLLITGHFTKAEELYNVLLNQASNNDEKLLYYNQLGLVHTNQGEYKKAICYYKQVLEIQQKSLPSNHPDLAALYGNIGNVYENMGEYSKALSFCEKVLEMFLITLPPIHPSLVTLYRNIANIYYRMGEYSKALLFHEKTVEILQKKSPFKSS